MENIEQKISQDDVLQNAIPVTLHQTRALRNCISKKIDSFSIKGKKNKTGATIAQISIIIFSVATPILIGWTGKNELLINLALICSAITAGSNMLYNFFDYKELWVQYKVSINELESIIAELDYLEALGTENIKQLQVDILFNKYLQICADTNRNYREIRLTKDTPENKNG